MSERLQITLKINQDLEKEIVKKYPDIIDFRILSEALDARGANLGKIPRINYTLEVIKQGQDFEGSEEHFNKVNQHSTPLIIGAGPAGLFAALRLSEYGIKSIIFERGGAAQKRMKKIARFWRYGEFDADTNVCFGEGGAGLFSDGKLITRVKSPFIKYVMSKLVEFGAPAEIAYQTNPHLGSNKIRVLIEKITSYLLDQGVEIYTDSKVEDFVFQNEEIKGVILADGKKVESDTVILATGHSADDIYKRLLDHNVAMTLKDFAVGVRVEHPRTLINKLQYGDFVDHPKLDTARYRLSYQIPDNKRGCYSFCMCPGGYVLSSGTDHDGIVVNGMSNYRRNSPWSNSAFVITVRAEEDLKDQSLTAGLDFQRKIEKNAFLLSQKKSSGREVPAQKMVDFLSDRASQKLPKNSCPSGIFEQSLNELLPEFVINSLKTGFEKFNQYLPGFVGEEALLMAPETRTSAPLTISRDKETLESLSHKGLFPCGEGAGYAGGITSAAIDGIKIAEKIVDQYRV